MPSFLFARGGGQRESELPAGAGIFLEHQARPRILDSCDSASVASTSARRAFRKGIFTCLAISGPCSPRVSLKLYITAQYYRVKPVEQSHGILHVQRIYLYGQSSHQRAPRHWFVRISRQVQPVEQGRQAARKEISAFNSHLPSSLARLSIEFTVLSNSAYAQHHAKSGPIQSSLGIDPGRSAVNLEVRIHSIRQSNPTETDSSANIS